MEQAIKDAYNDEILKEFMGLYGIGEGQIELLDGFESFVYEVSQDGRHYALRISHTGLRRSKEEIPGEAEFIHYLAMNGVACARPLLSPQGRLVEESAKATMNLWRLRLNGRRAARLERKIAPWNLCGSLGPSWDACIG